MDFIVVGCLIGALLLLGGPALRQRIPTRLVIRDDMAWVEVQRRRRMVRYALAVGAAAMVAGCVILVAEALLIVFGAGNRVGFLVTGALILAAIIGVIVWYGVARNRDVTGTEARRQKEDAVHRMLRAAERDEAARRAGEQRRRAEDEERRRAEAARSSQAEVDDRAAENGRQRYASDPGETAADAERRPARRRGGAPNVAEDRLRTPRGRRDPVDPRWPTATRSDRRRPEPGPSDPHLSDRYEPVRRTANTRAAQREAWPRERTDWTD